MAFWGRLFAFLLGLLLVLIAMGITMVVFNLVPVLVIQEWITSFYLFFHTNFLFRILGIFIIAAFVVVAFFLFRFLISRKEESITYATGEGEIRISFESIKALAQEALKSFSEIILVEPRVEKIGNNLILNLSLAVKPETSIPDFSTAVKNKVRERIERQTGVTLSDIRLSIDLKKEEGI
ncbi:MAG: alkaline shock response membrane anchor protein AmaP [Candidatus Atribacteria bacterium]|nr:alkaline shock response membrane anchor protein AmaP [Candidatus Atribacteria bacterium]